MIPDKFCHRLRSIMIAQKDNPKTLGKITNKEIEILFKQFEIKDKREDIYHIN